MTTAIMEYKQNYFEVDNEVEGELIVLESRDNVVVDFLNNYPELWEIIYKFKEELEKRDGYHHYIKCMEWEINWLNSLNIEKLTKIYNWLAPTFYRNKIVNRSWKNLNNNQQDFRLRVFQAIQAHRTLNTNKMMENIYLTSSLNGINWTFTQNYWKIIQDKEKYNLHNLFSNKTIRKNKNGGIRYLYSINKEFEDLMIDSISRLQNGEDFETNIRKGYKLEFPSYDDIEFGLRWAKYISAKPKILNDSPYWSIYNRYFLK